MFNFWKKKDEIDNKPARSGFLDQNFQVDNKKAITQVYNNNFQRTASDHFAPTVAMDSIDSTLSLKQIDRGTLPDNLLMWYGSQSFIGYQTCAMLSQHWLIQKACNVPAREAVRKGWEVTVNDGNEVDIELVAQLRKLEKKYKLTKNMTEFVKMGRVFGIRIAMFKVESTDPKYYENPFNIDGIKPNSYKGISQIDPYWCAPELDTESAGDPSAISFYEPTYWIVAGQRIHKSHLVIFRGDEVPDILKPTYLYGGLSVPQKICERVYNAERTANEAPALAMSKRTTMLKVDMDKVMSDQQAFEQTLLKWIEYRDNFGVKVVGIDEDMQQFDTALGDFDNVTMTQYQLVASAANVPVTKLLGTTPKGFNSTGEYEEASYHEELESIQTHDLEPLLERHYAICIRSDLNKKFEVDITWNALDALTENEQADINLKKSQTDLNYINMGAVDASMVHEKLITDEKSGFNGLETEDDYEEEDLDNIASVGNSSSIGKEDINNNNSEEGNKKQCKYGGEYPHCNPKP